AFALIGLEELLKSSFEHWKLIKGLIIIALVFALPGGLQQLGQMLRRQAEHTPPVPVPAAAKEAVPHA
ncbi:MAG: branched-chain amino acid ABC transporter permease, partial [Aestuariivirga sp.]